MTQEDSITTVGPMPTPPRSGVCWGSIFAGSFIAVGAWLLLHLLGMGIGLTAIEPHHPGSLRSAGIGAGVWTLIAPILALFIGGCVAGRLTGPLDRMGAAIHGAVVWALATVASVTLLWMALSAVVGGAVAAGSSVAAGGAVAVVEAAGEISPESLGLSADDLLAPVNRRLQSEGKPTITSDQLMASAREAFRTSVREGRFDRQIVIDVLARNTDMNQAEASDIANSFEQRYNARLNEIAERARTTALEAVEGAGKAILGLSLAMLVGLGAAIGGSLLGIYRSHGRTRTVHRPYARAD